MDSHDDLLSKECKLDNDVASHMYSTRIAQHLMTVELGVCVDVSISNETQRILLTPSNTEYCCELVRCQRCDSTRCRHKVPTPKRSDGDCDEEIRYTSYHCRLYFVYCTVHRHWLLCCVVGSRLRAPRSPCMYIQYRRYLVRRKALRPYNHCTPNIITPPTTTRLNTETPGGLNMIAPDSTPVISQDHPIHHRHYSPPPPPLLPPLPPLPPPPPFRGSS